MIFLAGGDSFTYGSELKDEVTPLDPLGTTPPKQQVSLSTFPALLAKDFGLDYRCAAHPGFSNSAIRRTTMNMCESLQDVGLVFVTWTFPGRYEFRFNYDTEERWRHWYSLTPWSAIDDIEIIKKDFKLDNPTILENHINNLNRAKRTGVSTFAKIFYQHVGDSDYWKLYNSLSEIVMLQQYLQLKNIPYIFSLVDECLLNNSKKYRDESMQTLIKQLSMDDWILFPGDKGFYTWARDEEYPIGATHPLEDAHKDAAKLFKEKVNELVKKSI